MNKTNFFSAIFLIIVGVIGRIFLIDYVAIPNFEIITALTLVSAVFLGRIWGIIVPLSIIAITDAVIGNNSVLFFTWSAFAIIGVLGWLSRFVILNEAKRSEESRTACPPTGGNVRFSRIRGRFLSASRRIGMTIVKMLALGIGSSIFFFLYTNFGWWLATNMYPHTWDGLIQCYIMGLPFFKNNLIGNLIFVPIASGVAMYVIALKSKFKMFAFGRSAVCGKNYN